MAEIEDVLQDEKFVRKILECKTKDEVKTAFKEKKIDLSDEKFEDLKKFYSEAAREVKKMTPEELKQVSGGNLDIAEKVDYAVRSAGALSGGAIGAAIGYKWAKTPNKKGKDIETWRKVWRVALSTISGMTTGLCLGLMVGTPAGMIAHDLNENYHK